MHSIPAFQCGYGYCGEQFGSPQLLKEHISNYHGSIRPSDGEIIADIEFGKREEKMTFECYLCRESFEKFTEIRSHLRMKHFKSPTTTTTGGGKLLKAKCSVCWTNLYDDTEVNGHLCEHIARLDGGSVNCEYCPEQLTSIVKLFKHVNTKHAKIKTLYRCIKCAGTFPVKSFLKYHQHVHTQEIHKCSKCSKVFETLSALNKHIKRHESNEGE